MKKTILLGLLGLLLSMIGQAQEPRFLTSDSVHLYIKVKGKGSPCLYIHGGPGAGSYWMEKFSGAMLEARFQMIYVDLRGVGRSSSPKDGNYSMERMLLDFEELRQQLGIEQWVIMGHSFSGTLTTGYALRYPNSIKGMMHFNCTLHIEESLTQSWIPHACQILEITDKSYYEHDSISTHEKLNQLFRLLREKDLGWKMAFAQKENERILNETYQEFPDWNGDFAAIGLSHKDYLLNFKAYSAQINIPTLFFYGKYDWTVGPEHYKGVDFTKMLLWESLVGHMPFLENMDDLEEAIDIFQKKFNL